MKYIDEYRDKRIAQALAAALARRVTRPWVLMEICGGQTHTLMRYGIDEMIPDQMSSSTVPAVRSVSQRSKPSIMRFTSPPSPT